MAKRSRHAVSAGQEARSERPATGHGQPRAAAMDRHRLKNLCYGGAPSLRQQSFPAENQHESDIASDRARLMWEP